MHPEMEGSDGKAQRGRRHYQPRFEPDPARFVASRFEDRGFIPRHHRSKERNAKCMLKGNIF